MQFLKKAGGVILRNKAKICSGAAVIGLYGTAYLASKATLKANEILLGVVDDPSKLSIKDKVKLTWKEYIPAAAASVVTVAALYFADRVHTKNEAALMMVYQTLNDRYLRYQKQVVLDHGPRHEMDLTDRVAQGIVDEKNPGSTIIMTGYGKVVCYDDVSGREFENDIETIRRIENELNRRLRSEIRISLNELYYELGLKPNTAGDLMGFDIDTNPLCIQYSSTLNSRGQPCLVLHYNVIPL